MTRKTELVLALVTMRSDSRTSMFRGARFQRERVEKAGAVPFTVIAKLDLVALFFEAAGLKKGAR